VGQAIARTSPYPPTYFPAITHFTDSITALPKEVVRHFSLLKEVDAKACGPEETLAQLTELAFNPPASGQRPNIDNEDGPAATAGGRMEVDDAADPVADNANSADGIANGYAADEASDTTRRHIFLNLRYVLSEMLMTLDEKNHVLSTANDALNKELARMDTSYPYIENEVSEEARLGSLRHWAYNGKNGGKSNGAATGGGDRPRRDALGASGLAIAAVAEEATGTRADRREALHAKRSRKQQQLDSDFDEDHQGRQAPAANAGPAAPKKSHAKVKKPVDSNAASTGPATINGQAGPLNPPNKRRKTEKATNGDGVGGAAAMERSISSAMGHHGAVGKGKAGSPRDTPAAEGGGRKRARVAAPASIVGAATTTTARKRYACLYHLRSSGCLLLTTTCP
jgi:hypothetical protein